MMSPILLLVQLAWQAPATAAEPFRFDPGAFYGSAQRRLLAKAKDRLQAALPAPSQASGGAVCSVPLLRAQVPDRDSTQYVINVVPVEGFNDNMPKLDYPAPPCEPKP